MTFDDTTVLHDVHSSGARATEAVQQFRLTRQQALLDGLWTGLMRNGLRIRPVSRAFRIQKRTTVALGHFAHCRLIEFIHQADFRKLQVVENLLATLGEWIVGMVGHQRLKSRAGLLRVVEF